MLLPEFRLEAHFAKWEFKARHHLTASDAQTLTLAELLALVPEEDREAWPQLQLGYVEIRGMPALRRAIAQTYASVTADEVLCFAGAEEGLFCALHALLDDGDHAVVLVPNYQSMESVPLSICGVSGVALRPENGWDLDLDDVRRALRPNTRVVAVNFPNNPTGKVISEETFRGLIALCAERGIVLFCDEVYRGIERDPQRTLPQAIDLYDRAVSLNAVSKAFGLPGLRVGWIACRDAALLERMEQLKHYLSICNAAPSEALALMALKAAGAILDRNRALVGSNLRKLDDFFSRNSEWFEWYEPEGGCTAFPRYLGKDGVEVFCERLVQEAGVLLLPASIYRSELLTVAPDRFRIGYGRRGIEAALSALDAFLSGV